MIASDFIQQGTLKKRNGHVGLISPKEIDEIIESRPLNARKNKRPQMVSVY